MAIMVRLFWVKIVVVLFSAVESKTSSPHFNFATKYYNASEQTILTSGDLQNWFDPFEIIEKNEQSEIIEEDSDTQHHSSFCYFSFRHSIFLLKYLKANIPTIVFSDFTSPQKLFVLFHCWKLHT